MEVLVTPILRNQPEEENSPKQRDKQTNTG